MTVTETRPLRWSTTTRVLLGHAHAGRIGGVGPLDDFRALSPLGWRQADEIVADLSKLDLRCLLSSPSLRCRQTLMPLAVALGIDIEPLPELSRAAHPDALLELLRSDVAHGAVLCTHPPLIARVLPRLRQLPELAMSPGSVGPSRWVVEDALPEDAGTASVAAHL